MANGFERHLARFGPRGDYGPVSPTRARYYCRHFATSHSENFTVASLLLPRRLVPHFHTVYAYCRWADDLADEVGGGPRALDLLRWWRAELLAMYEGEARHPVMVALGETVREFGIPPKPFLDLLFAFEQDQLVKQYATYQQLLDYCKHSADPVGHLLLYLFGAYTPENAALSDRVCTALQLANFWQDVARDSDIGRVYLPEEDRRRFGYRDADLKARKYTPQFAALMRFEVERARDLFYRGTPLVDRVPPEVRVDVELFIDGGLAVLKRIERLKFNVWKMRPKLSKLDKGLLLGGALWRRVQTGWRY